MSNIIEASEVVEQTDLITIQQLPVIVEQLHSIKSEKTAKIAAILALPCTEDTVKEIKRFRAELNNDFKSFEARRKFVKSEILKPYEAFEMVYKECVTDLFAGADNQLRDAINSVEDGLKNEKRKEIEAFYLAELAAHNLDFPTFDQSGIKVGISDTIAALKRQASDFVSKTASEVDAIMGLPYADEIMVEYRATLNSSHSIIAVGARHKALEEQRARMESIPVQPALEPIPIAPAVPRVIVPAHTDDEITKTIRVVGSQRKIDALLSFLEDGWYKYEVDA